MIRIEEKDQSTLKAVTHLDEIMTNIRCSCAEIAAKYGVPSVIGYERDFRLMC